MHSDAKTDARQPHLQRDPSTPLLSKLTCTALVLSPD